MEKYADRLKRNIRSEKKIKTTSNVSKAKSSSVKSSKSGSFASKKSVKKKSQTNKNKWSYQYFLICFFNIFF